MDNPGVLAVATRFFIADKNRTREDQVKITRFVSSVLACTFVETLYVAVNTCRDTGNSVSFLKELRVPTGKKIVVLSISQWGRYIIPLNILLYRVASDGYEKLLYVNVEHRPTDTNIGELNRHLDRQTLAVGATLPVFHDFNPGIHTMNGMCVPADAFMLVRVSKLALTGFIGVSEAPWIPCEDTLLTGTPHDPGMAQAGMKEVPTFSLVQHILSKGEARVVLTPVTGAERDIAGITGARKILDDNKRQSACFRTQLQMSRVPGIPPGIVYHIL